LARREVAIRAVEGGADTIAGNRPSHDGLGIGAGDHGSRPRPGGDARRGQLRGHSPTSPIRAGFSGRDRHQWVSRTHVVDQSCVGIAAGVGGVQAVGVGEENQHLGPQQMREQGGDPIVVAEPDLVVRDGVVLVHHRNATEFEKPLQRLARVQVLTTIDEIVRNEQYLGGNDSECREFGVVHLHQSTLPDRGQRLEGAHVGGTFGESQGRDSGRHRRRGHQHHVVATRPQAGDLGADRADHRTIDHSPSVGERRGADLHDHETAGHARTHRSGV